MSYIVVQQYQFPIHDPFSDEYIIDAVEANVLNWHRARLIQKIVHKWVVEAIEAAKVATGDPNALLSTEEVEELRKRIIKFDSEYELSRAKLPKTSILEYNLDLLASNFLYSKGEDKPSRADIERIKKVPEIQARARELIKSGTFTLSELIT